MNAQEFTGAVYPPDVEDLEALHDAVLVNLNYAAERGAISVGRFVELWTAFDDQFMQAPDFWAQRHLAEQWIGAWL